jgi:hypothetical protein
MQVVDLDHQGLDQWPDGMDAEAGHPDDLAVEFGDDGPVAGLAGTPIEDLQESFFAGDGRERTGTAAPGPQLFPHVENDVDVGLLGLSDDHGASGHNSSSAIPRCGSERARQGRPRLPLAATVLLIDPVPHPLAERSLPGASVRRR